MKKPVTRLFAFVLCALLAVSQLGMAAESEPAETTPAPETVETVPAEPSAPAADEPQAEGDMGVMPSSLEPDIAPIAVAGLSAASEPAFTAGVIGTRTVTITAVGGNFKATSQLKNDYFTLSGINGLTVSSAVSGEDPTKSVTLTVTGAPLAAGTLTIYIDKQAYEGGEGPASVTVDVGRPKGTVTGVTRGLDNLTAGEPVSGTITLTSIDSGKTGLIFTHGSGTMPEKSLTLNGLAGVSVGSVSSKNGMNVELTLTGAPASGGNRDVSVTLYNNAFDYGGPGEEIEVPLGSINVAYPTVTLGPLLRQDGTLTAGEDAAGVSLRFSVMSGPFKSNLDGGWFTLDAGDATGDLKVATATNDGAGNITLGLSGKPLKAGTLKSVTVSPEAFEYQPERAVTVTGDIPIAAATVSVSASAKLTAGVNGGTITLTAAPGTVFEASPDEGLFSFDPADGAAAGLTIDAVNGSGNTVTLTIGGTPKSTGDLKVKIEPAAFKYQPDGAFTAEGASVGYPTITLTADPAEVTEGDGTAQIKLTIDQYDDNPHLTFAESVSEDDFSVSGTGYESIEVADVTRETGNGTVVVTLSAAPHAAGKLTITAKPEAFTYRPAGDVTADVTVNAPTASLTGSTTLAAGTEGGAITITASGDPFKTAPEPGHFTLSGADGIETGLTVSGASVEGDTVTLTITGTPVKAGTLTVTADNDAFEYVPANSPVKVEVTIGYPEITLSADPKTLNEGEPLDDIPITLTAEGGIFNKTTGSAADFSISGHSELTLVSVDAEGGTNTAVLHLTGAPSSTDPLVIQAPASAFQYQPEKDLTVEIKVGAPTGKVEAFLNAALYADTPVRDQTITVLVEGSHGLAFADPVTAEMFRLDTSSVGGLTIAGAQRVSGSEVTLFLGGTPDKAGSVAVYAEESAFTYDPGVEEPAGHIEVQPAPTVTVTVSPASLTAGTAPGTIVISAVGGGFGENVTADMFHLISDVGGMTITGVKTEGLSAVLTVTGMPQIAGEVTVSVSRGAFYPIAAADPAVELTVEPWNGGVLDVEAEGSVSLGTSEEALADAVLTGEEKTLLTKGAQVIIILEESNIATTVDAAEKTVVETAAGDYTVGTYLDLALVKDINGQISAVPQTKTPVTVVFSVPAALRGVAGREFAVVRVHDGVGAVLQDLDGSADTITISTDMFSTYAILYRDPAPTLTATPTPAPPATPTSALTATPTSAPPATPTPAPPATPTPAPPATPASGGTQTNTAVVPDTGDGSMPALWLWMTLLCAAALVPVGRAFRRRKGQR